MTLSHKLDHRFIVFIINISSRLSVAQVQSAISSNTSITLLSTQKVGLLGILYERVPCVNAAIHCMLIYTVIIFYNWLD